MLRCPSCSSEVVEASRFCSSCGSAVADSDSTGIAGATVLMPGTPSGTGTSAVPARICSISSLDGRFAPGVILGGRYQIIGLVGKGGMGEVYRANDITLGQPVALKFLPEAMARNPAMLARFHGEVRIARQVSHPNVCRVYDIGETGGQLFLSMEYVDGEDLGSLLRRIGRLSTDKAVEFARKICAGLAAAHSKGVLHRDLKPANIMVNGEGNVVLMDFGLAGLAGELEGAEIRAGTPAYMAPEQLSGREVTYKSDIYALGLVLYEMFAGRRPFEADTLAEMMRQQETSQPASLVTVVKDLDPAVERVILRCLDRDPAKRPASALAVAAALPGGDPLAAALAAGETPSPDLVAASGAREGMRPRWGVLCFGAVVVLVIAIAVLGGIAQLIGQVPLELPPEALAERARIIARQFGYTDKPVDTAFGLYTDHEYLRYLESKSPADRWQRLRSGMPPAIVFWYRQSPRTLEIEKMSSREVTLSDPPPLIAGMRTMRLSPQGQLLEFRVVTNQVDDHPSAPGPPDWKPVFEASGLDMSRFQETEPGWLPASMADERKAWKGVLPGPGQEPVRVEAAAFRGKVVYAELVGTWSRAARMTEYQPTPAERAIQFALITILICVLAGATALAWYNRKSGRGDGRGAMRVAAAGGFMFLAVWILAGKHVTTSHELTVFFDKIAWSLLFGGGLWVVYIGLDPYIRRHWPQTIITWTRLLSGGVRDPLVGRDVLVGVVFGVAWAAISLGSTVAEYRYGAMPNTATLLGGMLGARHALALAALAIPNALLQMLVLFFLLFALRAVLRKPWLVMGAFVLGVSAFETIGTSTPQMDIPLAIVVAASTYIALTRFGFVTSMVASYVNVLLILSPLTTDVGAWYFGTTVFVLLFVLGMGAYGLHTALAGRSIIRDELL